MHSPLAPLVVALALFQAPAPDERPAEVFPRVEILCELEGGSGGLAVDSQGFVYCADFGTKLGGGSKGGTRIYRVDPGTGESEVFADGLRGASGNAIGPDGALYQSNIGGAFVSRVGRDGEPTVFLREMLRAPVGIAIDSEGMLFVADCGAGRIVEVTPGGEAAVLATSPLLSCPNGIVLDERHHLFVSNFNNGDVLEVTPAGVVTKLATLPGSNNGHLAYRNGELYVVARGAHQIYRVSLEGEVELFAGSGERGHDGGPLLQATFSFPNDIAFSPDGKTIYVNENGSTTAPHIELAPIVVRRIVLAE